MAINTALTVHYTRGNGGLMEQEHARMLSSRAPPPSPVFETIARLLSDPAHAGRHAALAAYGDRLRRQFAAQLIYNGHPGAAGELLDGSEARTDGWWFWRSAAMVPAAIMRQAVRLRGTLRR
jgi:hypothetical protein